MGKKILVILVITLFTAATAFAHSGRTNSKGCHNKTKDGTYHCH